ncbi:hypothetical protein AgCh_007622 [Apium graveolens]
MGDGTRMCDCSGGENKQSNTTSPEVQPLLLAPMITRFLPRSFPFSHALGPGFRSGWDAVNLLAAEECFTKNDIIFANRPNLLFGKHIGNNFTRVVWAGYGGHWRNLRKICSLEIFSSHRLQKLSFIRVEEVKSMVKHLFKFCGGGLQAVEMNMRPVFFELMFNVLTRMIAEKRYYGEESEKSEEAKQFQEIMNETARLASLTNMGDFGPV